MQGLRPPGLCRVRFPAALSAVPLPSLAGIRLWLVSTSSPGMRRLHVGRPPTSPDLLGVLEACSIGMQACRQPSVNSRGGCVWRCRRCRLMMRFCGESDSAWAVFGSSRYLTAGFLEKDDTIPLLLALQEGGADVSSTLTCDSIHGALPPASDRACRNMHYFLRRRSIARK
jgi:hypothetical protein